MCVFRLTTNYFTSFKGSSLSIFAVAPDWKQILCVCKAVGTAISIFQISHDSKTHWLVTILLVPLVTPNRYTWYWCARLWVCMCVCMPPSHELDALESRETSPTTVSNRTIWLWFEFGTIQCAMVLASMLCSVPSIQQIEPKTISKHKRLSTNQSRNAHSFLLSLKNLGTKTFETICRQIPSSVDNQTCNFFFIPLFSVLPSNFSFLFFIFTLNHKQHTSFAWLNLH